jgi:putative membrane protein
MLSKILKWLPPITLALLCFVHCVFAYKEITDWTRSAVEVIGMKPEDAQASAQVGRNQGLSNAFLAAGAAWALITWCLQGPSVGRGPATFFATWALVAGVFGWATFGKDGFLIKQALPGLVVIMIAWLPFSTMVKPTQA